MTTIDFWFDPVSPFAYLAFERLPVALAGLSYSVSYRPVVFAAMLAHHGSKGPAEIEPKRAWTFRHVHWLAHRHGIAMATPKFHPFSPIALSRLAWAAAPAGLTPSRHVCEAVLHHVWRGEGGEGADAEDAARLEALQTRLAPRLDPKHDDVKNVLRDATDEAIAGGVFGVPTIGIGDQRFWGVDALEMVADRLRGDPWFDGPAWDAEAAPRAGVVRR